MNFLAQPETDPTAIYRQRDGLYTVDMLTAAICHLDLFSRLAEKPADLSSICGALDLRERPADVMLTLLTAMGLLQNTGGNLLVERRWPASTFVKSFSMVYRTVFRVNQGSARLQRHPRGSSYGASVKLGQSSRSEAMGKGDGRRRFCRQFHGGNGLSRVLSWAGARGKIDFLRSPTAARCRGRVTGIYSCAIVAVAPACAGHCSRKIARWTGLRGEPWARADSRIGVEILVGDMIFDALPTGFDMHLFSNVLHDWDEPLVKQLLAKSAATLPPDGLIIIHDAHINADKTGPLPRGCLFSVAGDNLRR